MPADPTRRRCSLHTCAVPARAIAVQPRRPSAGGRTSRRSRHSWPSPPACSARPAKRCPTAGRTLATERFDGRTTSRVWRSRGVTYGCTVLRTGRARTSLLTRAPTGLVELDDDTVAWTTPRVAAGVRTARVSAFDLDYGTPVLRRVAAVPTRAAGVPRRPGAVDVLRVSSGGFVAWIADGTTVVVGADPQADLQLVAPGGATSPLHLDGAVAVAATYPADPAVAERLRASLEIGVIPGDPGPGDECVYSYATAFRWDVGPGQAFEAQMRGQTSTYGVCD
jgi:hypothetical protein